VRRAHGQSPFAGDVKQTDLLAPYELAHKLNKDGTPGKLESAVGRDLLFIERNLDFLRPGGRMAVVLPQGRFNNAVTSACASSSPNAAASSRRRPASEYVQAHTGTKTSASSFRSGTTIPMPGPLCPKADDYNIFFATQRKNPRHEWRERYERTAKVATSGDAHGHWVVQHDLFNHDGLTADGIAEHSPSSPRRRN